MKIKWLLLFLSITSTILPMEESEDQAIEMVETQEERLLEDRGLPNEMWVIILRYSYLDPAIFNEAKDIYEAIEIIEKHFKIYYLTISLVCKAFKDLNISKEKLDEFKITMSEFYIPYLNEKFLESREGKEGLYPKNDEWDLDSRKNTKIALFIATRIAKANNITPHEIFKFGCKISRKPNLKLIKLLLTYGLNINDLFLHMNHYLLRNMNLTLLIYLVIPDPIRKDPESLESVIIFLLRHKANPNLQDDAGNIPLHYAAKYQSKNIVENLLEYSSNPNMQNLKGETALHYCIWLEEKLYINLQLLLEYNANPNIPDNNKETPLHRGIRNYDNKDSCALQIIILLLQYGANPGIKNNQAKNVFDLAQENNFHEFPKLVRKYAQNTLTKICILHVLNNLPLYEDKLDILPLELRDKINSYRS